MMRAALLCFLLASVVLAGPPAKSPAGLTYTLNPAKTRVADSVSIFTNGAINARDVLSKLSQYDENSETVYDPDRCGPTAIVAACINSPQPVDALGKFIEHVKKGSTAEQNVQPKLLAVKSKLDAKTLTFGDLGILEECALKVLGLPDAGSLGFPAGEHFYAMRAIGVSPPTMAQITHSHPAEFFRPGQSYPSSIAINSPTPNHWVLLGKTMDGQSFVYDPLPLPEGPQYYTTENTPVLAPAGSPPASPSASAPTQPQQGIVQRMKKKFESMIEWIKGAIGLGNSPPKPTTPPSSPPPPPSAPPAVPANPSEAARLLSGKTNVEMYRAYVNAIKGGAGFAPLDQATAETGLQQSANTAASSAPVAAPRPAPRPAARAH